MINKGYRRIALLGIGISVLFSIIAWILWGGLAFLVFLIMGFLILTVFLFYTKQRYRDIGLVNDFFSNVLMGDYDLDIPRNEEGELSMLQNNIYKATVQLREKNELLAKEKKYLVDMLANISHQLKTPLTSMMMMNELLYKEESEEKRKEFIDIEEEQLEKMNWLIQNLLKLSKLDAGTIQLKKENVSIAKLIDESLSPFLIQMDIEEIVVEKRISASILTIDENWTVEAIRNIIKNCMEHMDQGGRLEIEGRENNLYYSIFIKDNGCGISQEELPHIFERFYRGKSSTKESVGIGLSLSKAIIEKQHGNIMVASEPNKGSCFEIRLYKVVI